MGAVVRIWHIHVIISWGGRKYSVRSRAKSAQLRQSRPDHGLGLSHFQALERFQLFPFHAAAVTRKHSASSLSLSSLLPHPHSDLSLSLSSARPLSLSIAFSLARSLFLSLAHSLSLSVDCFSPRQQSVATDCVLCVSTESSGVPRS